MSADERANWLGHPEQDFVYQPSKINHSPSMIASLELIVTELRYVQTQDLDPQVLQPC